MSPKVSIVIPCYNQGQYLKDALLNLRIDFQGFIEILIINDGSTDPATISIINDLEAEGFHIISQDNKGLSVARNSGILASKGEYILPLDSDNKIRLEHLREITSYMDTNPEVDVVYGDAMYFGERSGVWTNSPYNLQRLMIGNYIDACAVIRKSKLISVGLYDANMKHGWEDWELWLRLSFSGSQFTYFNKVLFDYRVGKASMSNSLYATYEKPNMIERYVQSKYPEKLGPEWIVENMITRFKKIRLCILPSFFLERIFLGSLITYLREIKFEMEFDYD